VRLLLSSQSPRCPVPHRGMGGPCCGHIQHLERRARVDNHLQPAPAALLMSDPLDDLRPLVHRDHPGDLRRQAVRRLPRRAQPDRRRPRARVPLPALCRRWRRRPVWHCRPPEYRPYLSGDEPNSFQGDPGRCGRHHPHRMALPLEPGAVDEREQPVVSDALAAWLGDLPSKPTKPVLEPRVGARCGR
jgi:hypothetical protein